MSDLRAFFKHCIMLIDSDFERVNEVIIRVFIFMLFSSPSSYLIQDVKGTFLTVLCLSLPAFLIFLALSWL